MDLEQLDIPDYIKILNNFFGTVLVVNKNRQVVFINDLIWKWLKVSPDEVLGKTIDTLVQEGYFFNSSTIPALDTSKRVIAYVRGKMDKPVLTVSTPFFDEAGEMEGVVACSIEEDFLEQIINEMVNQRMEALQLLDYLSQTSAANVPVVAESRAMKEILAYIHRTSAADSTVLLTGQTGTGKEVISKHIHSCSRRNSEIFLPVNCAAIPENLIESEFFGYVRGAFTGANREGKAGFFELANHGTLFLDEIGDVPLALQSKLLRVLETGEVMRLGSEVRKTVDVRIIAATNRDLLRMCQEGTFREDLYYRLNVLSIHIPPLAERPEDILPMARLFLRQFNKKYGTTKIFSYDTMKRLQSYQWPGNVRELRNVVERLVISSSSNILEFDSGLKSITAKSDKPCICKPAAFVVSEKNCKALRDMVTDYEKQVILSTIEQCDGNVACAAKVLRLHKSALYRKLNSYKEML